MAVAFDAKVGFSNTAGATSLSTSMTLGASANGLVVALMFANGTFPSGVAVTYNGVALTQITGTQFNNGGATVAGALYGMIGPAVSASHTLASSWTGSLECHMFAWSFSGVSQASVAAAFPNGTFNLKTALTASPTTVTITSATGDMVVAGLIQQASAWGTISGTAPVNDISTGNLAVAATYASGAATVTCTGAFTGTDPWVAFGCDVAAPGAGTNVNITGAGITATSGSFAKLISGWSFPGIGVTTANGAFATPIIGPIAGIGATASVGIVNAGNALSAGIPGSGATTASGSLASPSVLRAITGAGAITSVGNLAGIIIEPIPGVGSTLAAGPFVSFPVSLLGVHGTASAGVLAEIVLPTFAGVGMAVSASAQDITEVVLGSTTSGGVASASSFAFGFQMAGAGVSTAGGAFTKAISTPISGIGLISAAAGVQSTIIILPSANTGLVVAAGGFTFGGSITAGLTGVGGAAAAGLFTAIASGTLVLTGAGVTASYGAFVPVVAFAMPGAGVATGQGVFANTVAPLLIGASGVASPGFFNVSAGSGTSINVLGAGTTTTAGNFVNPLVVVTSFAGASAALSAGLLTPALGLFVPLSGIGAIALAGLLAPPIFGAGVIATASPLPKWSVKPTLPSAGMVIGAGLIPTSAGSFTFAIPGALMVTSAGVILVTATRIFPIERFALVSVEQRTAIVPVDRRPILVLR